jgi:hypothetical protein
MARYGDKTFHGNANSGRKPKAVELAEALATGLANHIHNEELEKLYNKDERTLDELKTLVTPVTVKGLVEKKELSGSLELKQITGMKIQSDGDNIQNQDTETN